MQLLYGVTYSAEYCDERVLCFCLFVREHIFGTTQPIFTEFFAWYRSISPAAESSAAACSGRQMGQTDGRTPYRCIGHGSVFLWWRCDTSNFTDTRLPSVGFRNWSRFFAVSLQVTWVINPAVGCHYFPPGLQLPPQSLTGLLPISLLGEHRYDGCEQFA